MTDVAISQINSSTQLLVPAQGDLSPITDVSDTTESSNGTTKPINQRNLFNGACDWIVCLDNEVVCVDNKVVMI